jgi:hypothetical protein
MVSGSISKSKKEGKPVFLSIGCSWLSNRGLGIEIRRRSIRPHVTDGTN